MRVVGDITRTRTCDAVETATFGELFAGIGGMALGLWRAGWVPHWFVEIDPFCQQVLRKHWPEVRQHGDIRRLTGAELEPVDLVAGGFPCQPFSLAGQRRGTADDRYLWPKMLRIIEALRPTWLLGENVAGIIGVALDGVLSDLEGIGYSCETFIIPACAVGAPHRRDRVWIVAHAEGAERQWAGPARQGRAGLTDGSGWETQPGLGGVPDGLPDPVDGHRWPSPLGSGQYEWEPPRLIEGKAPHRTRRLRALGNAVVPQVAEVIGRAMLGAGRGRPCSDVMGTGEQNGGCRWLAIRGSSADCGTTKR